MDIPPKQTTFFLAITSLLVVIIFYQLSYYPRPTYGLTAPEVPALPAANATLGFGAIVAVSHATSPRRAGLLYAANLTGLEITTPEQPVWTDEHVSRFRVNGGREGEGSMVSRGSALAWLGHLNALRWFLTTNLTTALILEDDVDWSIHLRTTQIPLVAAAVRTLLPESSLGPSNDANGWADPSTWEILYLGHCSDLIPPSRLLTTPHFAYTDLTTPPLTALSDHTGSLLHGLRTPDHTRIIHQSHWPLCTFGYAITRSSTQRILDTFGQEDVDGKGKGCQAFDVRMLEACRDRGWKCWTVVPEVFHHLDAKSQIEVANSDDEALDKGQGENEGKRKRTRNIVCGARQVGFAVAGNETDDVETREWLTDAVGGGQCLEDWAEVDSAILG